ncbi:Uncharacterised protein [Enterobacter cloacae]|uniref:Uncharacterized protein n=1 Tax=Enterobacter cloacae TaxID=550 RepID=A0A377LWF3_ENTCL|nr:Uncharacterised protein [Enterobacter cloacae]
MMYAARPYKWLLVMFVLGLIAQILVGEKFTGVFSAIVFFITPYFIIHSSKFNVFSTKNIVITLVITFIFSIAIYNSYAAIVGQKMQLRVFYLGLSCNHKCGGQ